jgi:polar amino acid transport system substrate-binding protein
MGVFAVSLRRLLRLGLSVGLALSVSSPSIAAQVVPAAAADSKVVLIGTGEWTPYVEQARADAGPLGRLMSAVFIRAGYRVQYAFYPWARDIYMLQKGQLDAVMPYICNAERQAFSLCSEAVVNSDLVLFHRVDKPFDWHTLKDLEAYSMALTKGYAYGEAFDNARAAGRFKVQDDSRDDAGIRLLLAQRVDAYLQDRAVGYAILKRSFTAEQQQQLQAHPQPVSRNALGLLLVKNARGEQLRQAFNAGLQLLRDNGDLQRLQQALESGDAASWQPSR